MNTERVESIYQNERVTCAHHGIHDGSVGWCHKPATLATICNPNAEWLMSILNIGHYYCQEHAPNNAYPIPERPIVYATLKNITW